MDVLPISIFSVLTSIHVVGPTLIAALAALADAIAQAAAQTAADAAQSTLQSLNTFGAAPSLLAVGVYGWSDLNTVDDGSTLPPLTNDQCNTVSAYLASKRISLASLLKAELVKVLPVTSSSITFPQNITCGPRFATQTRNDQV